MLIILPHEGDAADAHRARGDAAPGSRSSTSTASSRRPRPTEPGSAATTTASAWQAGNYFAEQLDCEGNVVEIQGIAGISVTELRGQGFADAIEQCDGGIQIVAQQPADFLPDVGLEVMETILNASTRDRRGLHPRRRHGRGRGRGHRERRPRGRDVPHRRRRLRRRRWRLIAEGGLYRATFIYNPSMSASAVRLARLIALGEGMEELVEPEVPSYIQLPASTVTADNVDQFIDLGF